MLRSTSDCVVLKFGGTSVASRERWDQIVSIAGDRLEAGEHPFLVCSAVSGVSDALERLLETTQQGDWRPRYRRLEERHRELADDLEVEFDERVDAQLAELERLLEGAALIGEVTPRLRARVMATGELLSTSLGRAFLEERGFDVDWIDARDSLESRGDTPANPQRQYLSANCRFEPDEGLQSSLRDSGADLHLTQGFIARSPSGETVLLGRGGSDTSAAYYAAKLEATRLEIWTDVHGMFTANPTKVPSARLLKALDYEEAQELATSGADVLHPRCIDPVREHEIPVEIRCLSDPEGASTRISVDSPAQSPQVKAISAKQNITLVSMETLGMWQEVGFLADVFGCFKENGLSIDLIATSETNVTASLDPTANALDDAIIEQLLEDLRAHCKASEIGPCTVVSLVGRQIRSILDELGPALEVFDEQQVHLVSQAASDLNFTFVVEEGHGERLVRELHALVFGERREDELLGPTWAELTGTPQERRDYEERWWRGERGRLVELAETSGPTYAYHRDSLVEAAETFRALEPIDRHFYAVKANPNPAILELFEELGLAFECVSPGEVERVLELFPAIDRTRLLFTPNFAPAREYEFGFEQNVRVTVDNLHPLEQWPEVFRGREILVRIDPGRGRGHHEFVRTAGPQSKFGVAPSQLDRLERLRDRLDLSIVGLHAHLGSGIKDPGSWAETGVYLAEVAERWEEVEALNLGGGLGVASGTDRTPLDLEAVESSLSSLADAHPDYELWMEPGRFLVADAGVLLARVTQTKQKGETRYVGLETGMNSLIRPALYGAYHDIVNLTRLESAPTIDAEVVGPICESGDVLGHGRRLPETSEGDVLLVDQVGAYGRAMSSHYNLREPAREVVLD